MSTIYRVPMTKSQYDAYIAVPTNIIPNNYQVFITDASVGAPNLYTGDGTNTPAAGALDGEGGNTLVTNWTANTALNAGQIVLATVAIGGFVVGEHISSNTSRTTGATFNTTEAGNFTSVPEDTTILKKSDVVNTLTGTDPDKPVSALQAKTLKDAADILAVTVGAKTDKDVSVVMSPGYPTVSVARSFTKSGRGLNVSQILATSFSSVDVNGTSVADEATGQYIANTLNTSVVNEVSAWFGVVDGTFTKCVKAKFVNNGTGVDITITETAHWNGDVLADAGWTITGGVPANRQSTGTPASSNAATGYGLEALTVLFKDALGVGVSSSLASTSETEAASAKAVKTLKDTADTLATTVGGKAPLSSPAFTDTPIAPTAVVGTNTTQLATTAFVKTAVDTAVVGLLDYRGAFTPAVSSGATGYPTTGGSGASGAILKGDVFVASAAGFILAEAIQAGDSVLAKQDTPGQTATNWDKLNANVSYVPEDQASKGVANGYAGLDANSRVLPTNLPSFATVTTTSIAPILGANIGLPGYRRSKLIPINSTTTGTGDYQVEIVVGESAGSVGANFHLGGNSLDFPAAQKDSGEFQFVSPDSTIVPFFVAEVTGTTPNRVARIFLRIPGITGQASSIQKLVFLLYDNNVLSVASQMSAIASVFNLLADDFDGAAIDAGLWVSTGITTTPASSILTFGGGNVARLLDSVATFGDNTEILGRLTFTTTAASTSQFGYKGAVPADNYLVGDVWDTNTSVWTGATRTDLATSPDATSRLYRLRRNVGAGVFTWWNGSAQITQNSTGVPTVAAPVRGWNTYDNSTSIDWIAVRQHLAVPPTLGTVSDV